MTYNRCNQRFRLHSLLKPKNTFRKRLFEYLTFNEIPTLCGGKGVCTFSRTSKRDIPFGVYEKEWKGTGDWLGTGRVASQHREFRPFEKAKDYVHSLGLQGEADYGKCEEL